MRLALSLILITSLIVAANGSLEGAVREVSSRQNAFSIPFRLPAQNLEQGAAQEIQLFSSQDKGASWQLSGTVAPQTQNFAFRAPRDGEYWFSLRTRHQDGKVYPAGPHEPQLRVTVDTHKPRLDLVASRTADGGVLVQWQAVDENLDLLSLKIETSANGGRTWQSLAIADPPKSYRHTRSGHATFWPSATSQSIQVRAEIHDSAKNRSVSQSTVSLVGAAAQSNTAAAIQGAGRGAVGNFPTVGRSTEPMINRAPIQAPPGQNTNTYPNNNDNRSTLPIVVNRTQPRNDRMVSHNLSGTSNKPVYGRPQDSLLSQNSRFPNPTRASQNASWPAQRSTGPLLGGNQPSEELPPPMPDAYQGDRGNSNSRAVSTGPNSHGANSSGVVGFRSGVVNNSSPGINSANQFSGSADSQINRQAQPNNSFSSPSPMVIESPFQDNRSTSSSNPSGNDPGVNETLPQQNRAPIQNNISQQDDSPRQNNTTPVQNQRQNGPMGGQAIQMVNSGTFDLEYDLESVGPAGIAKVELWATRDGGQTWSSYGVDSDHRSPFRVNVMQEGNYGFRVVVESASGLGSSRPNPGDQPDVWIGVDMTKPVAQFTSMRQGQGNQLDHLVIHWQASDARLADRPIAIYYAATPDGPWATAAAGLQNTGEYAWRLPREAPDRFYLRIEARDAAGNLGSTTTPQPAVLNRPRPQGHIRGVRPVVKSAFLGGPTTN